MRIAAGTAAALLLSACNAGGQEAAADNSGEPAGDPGGWTLQEQGSSAMLVLVAGSGDVEMRMICPGQGELLVNVPAFRPIGSEERMAFGQGGTAETLVAGSSGDEARGGVTARGPVPGNLGSLISGRVAANYGAQNSGPHPPLPPDLLERFVRACAPERSPQPAQADNAGTSGNVSACLIEDGERIPEMNLHAVGTEPFWAADIKGRCVTYSTPENIDGTRIWTKFDGSRDRGVWTGYYQDQRFVLRTYPKRNCSDGMSDKVYPVGVTVVVAGEERTGCAEYK